MNLSDIAGRIRNSKYADAATFRLYEWHFQLERRIHIASQFHYPEITGRTEEDLRQTVRNLVTHPLRCESAFGELMTRDSVRAFYAENGKGTGAARFMTLGEYFSTREMIDGSFLAFEKYASSPFIVVEELDKKVTDSFSSNTGTEEEFLVLDMNAPKVHLLEAVERLLISLEGKNQKRVSPSSWYGNRLLPLMDLFLLAKVYDIEPKEREFSRAIPFGADPEAIRKTTQPLAKALITQSPRGLACMKRLRLDAILELHAVRNRKPKHRVERVGKLNG